MVDLSNIISKVSTKFSNELNDSSTTEDIVDLLHRQNLLLQRLVDFNDFNQSDTDKTHIEHFNFHVAVPANTIALGTTIVPALLNHEIYVDGWSISIHGGMTASTSLFTLGIGLKPKTNYNEYPQAYLIHDLYMSYNGTQNAHVDYSHPRIVIEDRGDVQFAIDQVPSGPGSTPALDVIVYGRYYDRKNQPSWTLPFSAR